MWVPPSLTVFLPLELAELGGSRNSIRIITYRESMDQFVKHIITKHIMVFKLKDFCWVFITIHWINIKHPFQNGCSFCSHSFFFLRFLTFQFHFLLPHLKETSTKQMLGMSSEFSFHLSFFHIFCSPGFFFTHRQPGTSHPWQLADLGYGSSQCWRDAGWDELGCDGWGVVGRGFVFPPFFGGILVAGFFCKTQGKVYISDLVYWCTFIETW